MGLRTASLLGYGEDAPIPRTSGSLNLRHKVKPISLVVALGCLLVLRSPLRAQTDTPVVAGSGLRSELLTMREEDQRLRAELVRQMNSKAGMDSAFGARVGAMDRRHTARLQAILVGHGWPGWRLVGKDGSRAAWVLAQHADADRAFQRRALELLGAAVAAGDASSRDMAFLTDRVRRAEGRPQVYGTQTVVVDCRRVPYPIEDSAGIARRRADAGLPPLAEYLEMRRRQLGTGPGCDADGPSSPR